MERVRRRWSVSKGNFLNYVAKEILTFHPHPSPSLMHASGHEKAQSQLIEDICGFWSHAGNIDRRWRTGGTSDF